MQNELVSWASWGMIACGLAAFARLATGTGAPYGRYSRQGWGPMLSARTAWIVQEVWSLLMPVWLLLSSSRVTLQTCLSAQKAVLLGLFCLHYVYRSLVFPFRIRSGRPTPAVICLLASAFCICNGLLQGWWLLREPAANSGSLADVRFLVGCAAWAAGWGINLHADATLRSLRKPGSSGYSIPRGGMFEVISGANYFGEIFEWCGWALSAGQLPAAAFAVFTACNTGPRAWHHHKDYRKRFGSDYPQHRKAVIPFVL